MSGSIVEVKTRPILFSGAMVLAILEDRKTQTRRIIRPQPEFVWGYGVRHDDPLHFSAHVRFPGGHQPDPWIHCPYGKPGDRLWVKETFHVDHHPDAPHVNIVHYAADLDPISQSWAGQWRSSRFMPRWASRIALEIMGIRVERLQDITEEDAFAEGISGGDWLGDPIGQYAKLWDEIYGEKYPWANPWWVWVIEFGKVSP